MLVAVRRLSVPTMNISLPEAMKSYVEEQVQRGEYGSAREYVRDLVRRDRQVRAQAELEVLPIERTESGEPMPVTASY